MIFGTDGIRGRFGKTPMDIETIEKVSSVLGRWLPAGSTVVMGSDTRASGPEVRKAISSRLGDVTVLDLGIVPTPVVAYETMARGAKLGIMITASHNPAPDNGLKFFDEQGLKISSDVAKAWSDDIEGISEPDPVAEPSVVEAKADNYKAFIHQHFKAQDFAGLNMGFDLAHGAGVYLVKELAAELELDAVFMGDAPDGNNINKDVGALHTDQLAALLDCQGLAAGFALDGDGDRLIVVQDGEIPGDAVIYALSQVMANEGKKASVVGTIMCGKGLELALAADSVDLVRTDVGDQNVLKEIVAQNLYLGGEPSGHLIQNDLFPAGDGFLGALRLAKALAGNPQLLREAVKALPPFEAFEKSYPVGSKPKIETVPQLLACRQKLEQDMGDQGRLILRYSGTEPKIRVFVEAKSLDAWRARIDELVDVIHRTLI